MLWEIIRKEIQQNINSPKLVFTFLLCTILILLSVYTGANNYRGELREYQLVLLMGPSYRTTRRCKICSATVRKNYVT